MRTILRVLVLLGMLCAPVAKTAADDCRRAVELYNQGTLSGDFKEKENLFNEALKANCGDVQVQARIYNNLGDAYEDRGFYDEAIEKYRKAAELDPALDTPLISLGDVYSKIGDSPSARRYYERYCQIAHFKTRDQILSSLSIRSHERALVPVPSEDLYFGFDRAVLTEESEKQLEELLAALQNEELRSYRFELAGHACSIGSDEYNQSLSEKRAESVAKWLEGHGYPEDFLVTVGYGEKKPIADNSSEEGRRINRRVEIRCVGVDLAQVRRGLSSKESEAATLIEEGYRQYRQGDCTGGIATLEKALAVCREIGFIEGKNASLGNLYLFYLADGDNEKARRCLNELQNVP